MLSPAHLANPLREMPAGRGDAGGAVHLHVHSPDAQGVRDFFDRDSDHVARAVTKAVRNGTLPRPRFG